MCCQGVILRAKSANAPKTRSSVRGRTWAYRFGSRKWGRGPGLAQCRATLGDAARVALFCLRPECASARAGQAATDTMSPEGKTDASGGASLREAQRTGCGFSVVAGQLGSSPRPAEQGDPTALWTSAQITASTPDPPTVIIWLCIRGLTHPLC